MNHERPSENPHTAKAPHEIEAGVFAGLESIYLKSAPIPWPWVLSGHPHARSGCHSSGRDQGSTTNVWDCSAGSFRWHFGWDETVLILEGSVKVTSPTGKTTVMNAGDIGYFPAGDTWVWEIETYVRKLAFCRRPASRLELLVRSFATRIRKHSIALKIAAGIAAATGIAMTALE